MKIDELTATLTKKRQYHAEQIERIDAVLNSIKHIDGLVDMPAKKVVLTEKSPNGIRYQMTELHPRDFVREYIRKKGCEVSMQEVFNEFNKASNKSFISNKLRQKAYINFCSYFATKLLAKYGFTKKLYTLEGIGRQVYLNLDSAIKLQTEKTIQNPTETIEQINIV